MIKKNDIDNKTAVDTSKQSLTASRSEKLEKNKRNKAKRKRVLSKIAISHKTKGKIFAAICAVAFSVALMAVGVVAAVTSFDVAIANSINVSIASVQGTLYAKRVGGIVVSDDENNGSGLDFNATNAEFYNNAIYDSNFGIYEERLNALQQTVNVADARREIIYLFKFVADEAANSTQITLEAEEIVSDDLTISYLYCFDDEEPANWTDDGVPFLSGSASSITVPENGTPGNRTLFIRARLAVSGDHSVHIGDVANPLTWSFSLNFEPATTE